MEMTSSRITHIIEQVADYYGVPAVEVTGPNRAAEYVRPRHVAMYLSREENASLSQIGKAFGGRHRTTVLAAVRGIEGQLRREHEPTVTAIALLREKIATTGAIAHSEDRIAWLRKQALRRLRELAWVADQMAAECRRLEGQLTKVSAGD